MRHQELFVFPGENKKLRMVYHQEFFVFPKLLRCQITEYSSPHGLLMKILGMYLFPEVEKPELGFPNHEFIQLWARTSARRARVLPITV